MTVDIEIGTNIQYANPINGCERGILKTMANISEALQYDMQANNARLDVLKEWREKKITGYADVRDCVTYFNNGIPSLPPKSDYDLALEELDREFPGAAIEPIAPSIETEKTPPIWFVVGMCTLPIIFIVIPLILC